VGLNGIAYGPLIVSNAVNPYDAVGFGYCTRSAYWRVCPSGSWNAEIIWPCALRSRVSTSGRWKRRSLIASMVGRMIFLSKSVGIGSSGAGFAKVCVTSAGEGALRSLGRFDWVLLCLLVMAELISVFEPAVSW